MLNKLLLLVCLCLMAGTAFAKDAPTREDFDAATLLGEAEAKKPPMKPRSLP